MNEPDRVKLVKQAADGNADALQRLIVFYHADLLRFVSARIDGTLQSHIDAEDILQQTYIRAFQAIENGQFGIADQSDNITGGFYKWIEAISHAQVIDKRRALQRQKRDVRREVRDRGDVSGSYPGLVHRLAGDQSTPSRQIAKEEAIAAVMSSLARLSEDQRTVVKLRFLEHHSVADVAARLDKTEAAVNMLCHRGLRSLRQTLVSISHFLSRL